MDPDALSRAMNALSRVEKRATLAPMADLDPFIETAVAMLSRYFGSPDAIVAKKIPDELMTQLEALGFNDVALRAASRLAISVPMTGRTRHGSPTPTMNMSAQRRVAVDEPIMRARYLVAAAKRLTEAEDEGRFGPAFTAEIRHRDAHRAIGKRRRAAARAVDDASARSRSGFVVWETAGDSRVSRDCATMNGRIFKPNDLPDGLLPGAVHVHCRCSVRPLSPEPGTGSDNV